MFVELLKFLSEDFLHVVVFTYVLSFGAIALKTIVSNIHIHITQDVYNKKED